MGILFALLLSTVTASPGRNLPPPIKQPQPPAIIDLSGETNWGTLVQTGRQIRITGHDQWEAIGQIRADGRVTIIWTMLSDGSVCPGVYDIRKEDGALIGTWGHASQGVTIGDDGSLIGQRLIDDVTYRIKKDN